MGIAIAAFLVVTGTILGGYAAVTLLPGVLASRRLDERLRDVAMPAGGMTPFEPEETIVKPRIAGPLPLDRKSTRLNSSHSAKSRMPSSA